MKQPLLFAISIFLSCTTVAQNVGIGTTTPNANAALDIRSNNKGLLTPRLSSNARVAMTNVAKGMLVYDTTMSGFYYHDGGKWRMFSELNVDSLTRDFLATPEVTANMSGNVITTARSGILYDNGGPGANYGNGLNYSYLVNPENNDSIVGYRVVVEQMNMAANDLLGITTADDQSNITIIGGTTTGTYYFAASSALAIIFQSDASGNAPGFRIRWSAVTVRKTDADVAPAFGWYFNAGKLAVRGGVSPNKAWATDSLGRLSFAFGSNAKAKGKGAVAMGSNVSADGNNSHAFGQFSTAAGDLAVALGYTATATGESSVAIGNTTSALGNYSTAIGFSNTASGIGAVAMGYNNEATADYSSAFGKTTVASQISATSTGDETVASGFASFATGSQTTASGSQGFAAGVATRAEGTSSVALGNETRAIGAYSLAIGYKTTADSYGSVVIGRNNKPVGSGTVAIWNSVDPLFTLANGSSSTLNNIMTVFKNGRIGIGTDSPEMGFHIGVGSDASLADGSGYMILGDVNSSNLVFDNNEIIARNNGANNTLWLQNEGGALETGGTAAKPGGGSWSATSDARLKQNIHAYTDGLQQVLKINPVYFNYNEKSGYDTSKQYVGILAQELKEIAPYMVDSFEKDGTEFYKADNTSMTYMLINAMKEQQQMIELQQQQLLDQQKQIETLKTLVKEKLK
jgi:hypothetical protein